MNKWVSAVLNSWRGCALGLRVRQSSERASERCSSGNNTAESYRLDHFFVIFCRYWKKRTLRTSSWLTSILPFLFISRIKPHIDFFISVWTDVRFWSTWKSLKKQTALNKHSTLPIYCICISLLPEVNSSPVLSHAIHVSLSSTSINSASSLCLHSAFSDIQWYVGIHTHCLWSLTPLQSVSSSPAAEGSYFPCVVCGSCKHLQGTGSYNRDIKSLGPVSELCNRYIMLHNISILPIYCDYFEYIAISVWSGMSNTHIHTCIILCEHFDIIIDDDCTCGPCAWLAGSPDRSTGRRSHRTASAAPACGRHRTSVSDWTHHGPLEDRRLRCLTLVLLVHCLGRWPWTDRYFDSNS